MTRWYQEKKREHYYKEAKKHGYRARSAYKLKQIQKTFKIIRERSNNCGWSEFKRKNSV